MPRTRCYVPPVALALGYLGLNDMEKVFGWLEEALAIHDVHLIYLPWDSKWETLMGEKRFRNLLKRSGLGAARAPAGLCYRGLRRTGRRRSAGRTEST